VVTPLAERQADAPLRHALQEIRPFHRGHDTAANCSFCHAHESLVSVTSGGLPESER
jgi:hypothetical protein